MSFNLTPKDRVDISGNLGQQKFHIEGKDIPLEFDSRKMYINIRLPLEEEIDTLEVYELTSLESCNPEEENFNTIGKICQQQKHFQKKKESFPEGIQWKDGKNV